MIRCAILVSSALLVLQTICAAEQSGIYGFIRNRSGTPLPDAEVLVQSEATGARWRTSADVDGRYSLPGLIPGRYKATVRLAGFRTVSRVGMVLASEKGEALDFEMDLIVLHQMITVTGSGDSVDPSSGESLLLTRDGPGSTLPANGRDFRSSFDVMPGVAVVPAAVSDAGQFTANGQRPNSNSFRVDGVNANNGAGGSNLPGSFPGASLPAMTAIGTTENLVSPENTQSVEFRTSSFAPEFGERPGAESFVTTRSGSDDFHGALVGHWRDSSWNARDWFANSHRLAYPRPFYQNAGAVFGGPIRRNRTYFFAAAERTKVSDRGLQLTVVPSLTARESAPRLLKWFLRGFSLPTGPDFGNGQAEGLVPLGRIGKLSSYNLRFDHSLGAAGNLFTRIGYSPSSSVSEHISASEGDFNWRNATVGLTASTRSGTIHDIRFNFSASVFSSRYAGNPWGSQAFYLSGGMFPGDPDSILPSKTEYATTVSALSVPGLGQFSSGGTGTSRQDQWEFRETMSRGMGRHQFRAGIDYIRLKPSRNAIIRNAVGFASDLQSLLDGKPLPVTYSEVPRSGGVSHTISTFVQDTVRLGEAVNVVYGARWELTPPTGEHLQLPTISGVWAGNKWQELYTGDINGAAHCLDAGLLQLSGIATALQRIADAKPLCFHFLYLVAFHRQWLAGLFGFPDPSRIRAG